MTPESGEINQNELWQKLQALEDGNIEPESRDELMKQVANSAAAQELYLEYFELSSILQSEASTRDEQGKLLPVPKDNPPGAIFKRSLLTAAAILALVAAIMSIVMVKQPDSALVSTTAGARWSVDGVSSEQVENDYVLKAGSSIRLESGTMEVRLPTGVRLVLQGPAKVAFPELHKPRLSSGWLWVDSAESDSPFEVDTPSLLVRDIGTRFGVRVLKKGGMEIHLIEGRLELVEKLTAKIIQTIEPMDRGTTISNTAEQRPVALARDPFPDLDALLKAPANYPTTIRSQHPAGYWRGGNRDGIFQNDVPEGVTGRSQSSRDLEANGPDRESGYPGFEEDNHAVEFMSDPKGTQLSLGITPVHSGILFQDDFDGEQDELNGSSPDITTGGASWMASSVFNGDGTITPARGTATLAFTPVNGVVYTLDATIETESGSTRDWIALGFADGQAIDDSRFVSGSVVGRTWMLHRAADSAQPVNRTWVGSIGRDWSWPSRSPLGGTINLRIILDTTKGASQWKSTWFAKRPEQADYHLVGAPMPLHNESISSVGFAVSGPGISGAIKSLSLKADPETKGRSPSVLADGPAKLSRKEGAISCWIWRATGGDTQEILWTAGEDPFDTSIQLLLDTDGHVKLFMENGRYDVLIRSERPLSQDGWHHVAGCWSPSAVELYLDGKQVARDRQFRGMQQGELSEFSFGRNPGNPDSLGFTGKVDEIAIWDRPLIHVEIDQQFRSAKGD